MPGPKESRAKPSRDNCKSCSSAGTPSCTNTAEGAGAAEKGTWIRRQTSCCHNSKRAACKACEGTRPPSAPTGPLSGGSMWLLHKKKPITEIKERFGPGLYSDGCPVMFECPEETLESGMETEWGGSYSPANPRQRTVLLIVPRTLRCSKAAVSIPAETARGGCLGKHCLASCPWLLAQGGHPEWEVHKRKPRKSVWLHPQTLRAGAAPWDMSQSHTPSQHIMCSCSSCSQLL